jgi:acyl carrier protein
MINTEKILEAINKACPEIDKSKIESDVQLREYDIDSMDFFAIILELQEILGKEIPDEDLDQLRTIASIQDYFQKHGF